MSQQRDGLPPVSGTDATSYFLNAVTLLMYEVTSGGAQVDIFTDSSFAPGTLVGTLTSPSSYPSSDSNVTFTASGITLNSASTYWVVLKALSSGEYAWAWTEDDTGSGIGFQHTWGYSDDSGSTWYTYDTSPQMMKVEGSPVPVPPSLLLFGPGLFGLAALRRWRRG